EAEPKVQIQRLESEAIENAFTSVLDNSISTAGTTISALTAEYKHLDELAKMMIMKLKDIHQQLSKDGDEWISKRDEILDSLHPFFTDAESLRDNSEALLRMVKKIDAYTKVLESRANKLF
ncbi:hypothetical protein WA538_000301, partial [Blastocystis sp. DL]